MGMRLRWRHALTGYKKRSKRCRQGNAFDDAAMRRCVILFQGNFLSI
jgi:hypothetical protein